MEHFGTRDVPHCILNRSNFIFKLDGTYEKVNRRLKFDMPTMCKNWGNILRVAKIIKVMVNLKKMQFGAFVNEIRHRNDFCEG